jgi:ABC-type transport system involved in multi-copper enzyme maturation permease subunit
MANLAFVVAKHELRSILKLWILLLVMVFFATAAGVIFAERFSSDPNSFQILLPFLSLAPMIFFPIIVIPYQFTMEKSERCIESLFSTPLTAKDVCAGKVIASTLLAYITSLIMTLVMVISIYLRYDSLIPLPLSTLTIILVINPITGGSLIGIFGIIQLINPSEIIGRLVLFAVFFGYCYCFTHFVNLLSNFSIPPQYMLLASTSIMAMALSFIALSLAKLLTEERVIKSE